ncbi:sigma-70 family RNA polymerase sigma factor [Actinoplanes solisilvae]|uniref:sigma-70 family RNA polymerase sigma factor n=1 Tax=Actinoplanes solisilvae TaxID=2486853 RepID=UPI001F0C1957|nr:sigma-70 family RNA polymerase sigma factor [Actinoplanes solisilvae]
MNTELLAPSPTAVTSEVRMSRLHAEHSRPLLNFLIGLTGGERHAAEDLLQETMIRAWRHLDSVPEESENARRWLFTVARRVAIDAVRMRKARPAETSVLDLSRIPAADDTPDTVLAIDALRRAVGSLSQAHRRILSELYFEGHSTRETATLLGVPVGTVKSRAHYALQTLRDAVVPLN